MWEEAKDLNISPKGSDLRAQFNMLTNTKSYKEGVGQGYKLSFHEYLDGIPAMVKIKGMPWVILEIYEKGRFSFLGIKTGTRISLIRRDYLSDVISDIHENRVTTVYGE